MSSFPLIIAALVTATSADGPALDSLTLASPANFESLASTTLAFAPEAINGDLAIDDTGAYVSFAAVQDQPTSAPADDLAAHASASHTNRFFQRGSWRWNIQLAAATDPGDVTLGIAGVGVSCFLEDNFTIDFELSGMYVDQDEDEGGDGGNTAGLTLAMLLRWHFWRSHDDRWSIYADAGAGILFTGEDVPAAGSSFNFTPQAGMGFSLLLDEAKDVRLLAGLRWYHISNANTFENNPGLNTAMLYAGVNFPF